MQTITPIATPPVSAWTGSRRPETLTCPTPEEQRRLAEAAHGGDRRSREAMILRNRRLALSLVRAYQNRGVPREDLEQEAIVGLIMAVDRFDPARGTAFSTYATFWIRQRLQLAVERTSSLTHLPRRSKRNDTRPELPAPLPRPTIVSLDAPATRDSDTPLGDLIADPASLISDPTDRLTRELAYAALHRIMDILPDRERAIVRARFGFEGEPQTLGEIGAQLQLSHERVRQLLDRALARLRHTAGLIRLSELTDTIELAGGWPKARARAAGGEAP